MLTGNSITEQEFLAKSLSCEGILVFSVLSELKSLVYYFVSTENFCYSNGFLPKNR